MTGPPVPVWPGAASRLIDPDPPPLSALRAELEAIEARGVYSNYGPVNQALERRLADEVFGGGHVLTVCNATAGLMLALKQAALEQPGRRYALMPSFTFAATAQAALWAGLVPLLCDIGATDWLADADCEAALLARFGDQVAALVPCTTFGAPVPVARYAALAAQWGCALVMDAAPALGTRVEGRQISAGQGVAVFSMHATKPFATAEGGVIHGDDPARIGQLRAMGNFGFEAGRLATLPGLNAKLPEVTALLGLAQVPRLAGAVAARMALAAEYRARLPPGWALQPAPVDRVALMFLPVLLPRPLAPQRPAIVRRLEQAGVAAIPYYSPHLAEHPYLAGQCQAGPLPVAQDVAGRVLALPLHRGMDREAVAYVVEALLLAAG